MEALTLGSPCRWQAIAALHPTHSCSCLLVCKRMPSKLVLHWMFAGFSEAAVTHSSDQAMRSLASLGWTAFFDDQIAPAEADLMRMRVATVHRARLTAESGSGPMRLTLPVHANTADHAVGDWVLVEPENTLLVRRLERKTLLQRRTEGSRTPQLIAANVNTLFIVTSCNDDLNAARLERYLAVANEAGPTPVIVLTKADQVADVRVVSADVV